MQNKTTGTIDNFVMKATVMKTAVATAKNILYFLQFVLRP